MLKILIIILLIIVGIIVAVGYVLGALRRFLGLSPRQAKTIFTGFKNMSTGPGFKNEHPKREQKDILYQKNDIVVLRGEAKEKVKKEK
ncbi:MAG TPA: hypothetical protein VEC36_12250 [Patescibacteria group bacterium]|nr:hypothetical protein [Patescibacteria group bacterium]